MTRDHDRWAELAAGHAVGALEPEDEELFVTHLRSCAECVRTLAEMTSVAAQLAHAAEPAEPPASLKAGIMDEVRRSERARTSTPVPAAPAQARRRMLTVLTGSRPTDTRAPKRPSLAPLAMAAALVAVIGLGAWNANLRGNVTVKDRAIARLEMIEDLAADPATVRVPMTSGIGAHGTALIRGSRGVVLLEGLPANPQDSIYVLWYQDQGGSFYAVDAFDVVDEDRVNVVTAVFGRPASDITRVAISRERGRVAPAAPSVPLVHGPTSAA